MDARDEDRARIEALVGKVKELEGQNEALSNPVTAVALFLDSDTGRSLIAREGRLRIALETIQKAETLDDVKLIAKAALK